MDIHIHIYIYKNIFFTYNYFLLRLEYKEQELEWFQISKNNTKKEQWSNILREYNFQPRNLYSAKLPMKCTNRLIVSEV